MSGSILLVLLIILVVIVVRLFLVNRQIRKIRYELEQRLLERTNQPLSIELFSTELNRLTASINLCLQEVERSKIAYIQKEKEFKEMIANIAHDLRTPLTAIKGNLQLLEQNALTDEQKQQFGAVFRQSDEMALLLERFWEYSYYSTSDRALCLEKMNLANLLSECLSDYVPQIEEKGFAVSYRQEEPVFIYAVREYCMRILQNLIQNCISHSSGDIEISVCQSDYVVNLILKNPVPENVEINVERIFDRFYNADRSRNKVSGLGLSIVALLADKMGGKVTAVMRNGELSLCIAFKAWTKEMSSVNN